MAIDLCNKREWQPAVGDLAAGFGNGTGADGQWAMPIEALGTHQREAVELARRTVLAQIDPRLVTGDPAAWSSDFGYELDRVAIRLDARPSAELHREALTNPDPAMREQALFEYADRNQPDAIELLVQAVAHDTDRQVRWAALWAIEKLGGAPAVQALQKFTRDPDPEIAEWAVLFRGELQTGDPAFDTRGSYYTPGRTFDETIPLLIHCDLYIRLDQTNQLWGKLSLAPQGLGRVYGHAHACPNVATRERQLVIAKAISGLHPDGSVHLDNYLFRGFTERTQADRGNFFFESHVSRPFFVSGRADDPSAGIQDTEIGFMRQGCWYLDHRFQIHDAPAIRYVRGRFQGWGKKIKAKGK